MRIQKVKEGDISPHMRKMGGLISNSSICVILLKSIAIISIFAS